MTVANLIMEDIEERAIPTFHSPHPIWMRYFDDIFTELPEHLVLSFHVQKLTPKLQLLSYVQNVSESIRRNTCTTQHQNLLQTTQYTENNPSPCKGKNTYIR